MGARKLRMLISKARKTDIDAKRFLALNRAAPCMATMAAVAVLASFAFGPPMDISLLLSALSGLALVTYPAFRNIFPHHSSLARNLLQFLGIGLFVFLINKARDYHVASGLDMSGYAVGVLMVQTLGVALLTAAGLLFYTRCFPAAINEE
jgi:hypothetical protein